MIDAFPAPATPHGQRLARIRRLSAFMAPTCLALAAALAADMTAYWLSTPGAELLGRAGLAGRGIAEPDLVTRLLALAVSAVPLGLLVYGLVSARNCFGAFARGLIFAAEPATHLWRFSIAAAASAIAQPFAGAALSVILSWNGPPGTKTLSIGFGSEMLLTLVFAGTLAVISWVLREATLVADENSQFI